MEFYLNEERAAARSAQREAARREEPTFGRIVLRWLWSYRISCAWWLAAYFAGFFLATVDFRLEEVGTVLTFLLLLVGVAFNAAPRIAFLPDSLANWAFIGGDRRRQRRERLAVDFNGWLRSLGIVREDDPSFYQGTCLMRPDGAFTMTFRSPVVVTPERLDQFVQDSLQHYGMGFASTEVLPQGWFRVTYSRVRPASVLSEARERPRGVASNGDAAVIGWTEQNEWWTHQIVGKHTLILGASGSGKGSVIWSMFEGISGEIAAGTVRVFGIDLKGGVEFSPALHTLSGLAVDFASAVEMLEDVVQLVEDRLTVMRENRSRKHVRTVKDPATVLFIDEFASLTYLAPDSKSKARVQAALQRILSTGRAAAISVIAAAQDPRKEALGAARDLFQTQIAMRFRTKDDAILALGSAAWEAGARCEQIPTSEPGRAYVIDTETGQVVGTRAFWVSDEQVRALPPAPMTEETPAPDAGGEWTEK